MPSRNNNGGMFNAGLFCLINKDCDTFLLKQKVADFTFNIFQRVFTLYTFVWGIKHMRVFVCVVCVCVCVYVCVCVCVRVLILS